MVALSPKVDRLVASQEKRRLAKTLTLLGFCVCASLALYWVLSERQGLLEGASFSIGKREWRLTEARSLLVLSALPLLLLGIFHSRADLPWQQRVLSFLLRAGFFVALAVGLGRPQEEEKVRRICTVALVDVSRSIADAGLERFRGKLSELDRTKGEKDELRLLAFAERAREIPLERSPDGALLVPELDKLRAADAGGATDIEGALELAAAWTRSDCVSRYVLFSDGIETRGSALSAIAEAREAGVRVSTEPLSERPPVDVAVVGVELPEGVRTGEPFEVRVRLNSTVEGTSSTLSGKHTQRTRWSTRGGTPFGRNESSV
jgi:von Willebrand factor type A domain